MIRNLFHLYRSNFWKSEKHLRILGVKIDKNCVIQKVSFSSEAYLIELGNNVYSGYNVLVLPGFIVGSDVIVSAGSIVTKSIPNGCIVNGNPTKIRCDIEKFKMKISNFEAESKGLNYLDKKEFRTSHDEDKFIKE